MSENYASIEIFKDARNRLGIILKQLAHIADDRDDEIVDNQSVDAKVADKHSDFRRKLAEMLNERSQSVLNKTAFRVSVLGEFNTGKSTLINALLGRKVLATSIKPKTAAKTILRYSKDDAYRVTYNKKYAHLNSSEINKSNNLAEAIAQVTSDDADVLLKGKSESVATQVKEVEIWCDSEFLNRDETEIIDTPGLGSVFEEHKVVTYSLIPEMDATLFLFPSDPGFGAAEKDSLTFIKQYVKQLLFIMTKADRLSPEDREDLLNFSKDAIEQTVKISVDCVYGVSATYQLEGRTDESGFDTFLKGLESFLVSSSGVARLQIPFTVAQTQCENLVKNTQFDIQRIDADVDTLRAELQRLEVVQSEVEKGRKRLIENIEKHMEDMVVSALDGIDFLPVRVENAVDKALDESNKESLKKADLKLQTIINDTVEKWVKEKNESFMKQANLLQSLVESELQRFVELIDEAMRPSLSGSKSSSISTPDTSVILSGRSTRLVLDTAVKAGGAFVTGVGATAVAAMVPALFPIVFSVLLSFPLLLLLPPLLPLISDLARGEQRIRNDIKKQLKKPILGNKVTIFEALVEGYVNKDGERHPGLRETLQTHFKDWSKNLKSEINNFVANLIGSQLTQIEKQIDQKESNRFDREQRLEMHKTHLANLQKISEELADLELTIQAMSGASVK